MDLYKLRTKRLAKFIEINAPTEIVYFACENVLLTKYKSHLKTGIHFIRYWISLKKMDIGIAIEFWWLRLIYGKRRAMEILCERD